MTIHFDVDLDPVSFITVGTEGPPGQRTFYLQAAQGQEVVSLAVEKEQAIALAGTLDQVLATLAREDPQHARDLEPAAADLRLLLPVEPLFRVAQLGLGVDEERHMIILVAQEGDDEAPGQRARLVGTYAQMLALCRHTVTVVGQGRPSCSLCGGPIDPEGHFCPRRNGHHHIATDE